MCLKNTGADQIAITSGNSAALGMVFANHKLRPGGSGQRCVAVVENPTYFLSGNMLADAGVVARQVPVDAEGMQVEPDNDCLAALLLSHRAKAFQKQREEAIECEKLLTDAQKEVDEAQAALLAAQRRLIKVPLSPLRSAG